MMMYDMEPAFKIFIAIWPFDGIWESMRFSIFLAVVFLALFFGGLYVLMNGHFVIGPAMILLSFLLIYLVSKGVI